MRFVPGNMDGYRLYVYDRRLAEHVATENRLFNKYMVKVSEGDLQRLPEEAYKLLDKTRIKVPKKSLTSLAWNKLRGRSRGTEVAYDLSRLSSREFAELSQHLSRGFYAGSLHTRNIIDPIARRTAVVYEGAGRT